MTRKTALYIHNGKIDDLGDLLNVARVEGRKKLKVDKVKVHPIVYPFEGGFLVVVSPEGVGCSKCLVVEEGKVKSKGETGKN